MKIKLTRSQLEKLAAYDDGIEALETLLGEGDEWETDWTRKRQIELLQTTVGKYIGWAHANGLIPMWSMSGADLSRANLSRAHLSGANLSGAHLSWANLSRAHLSGANLSGAHLSGANLSGADLSRADLSGADLSWADLSWADLSGADLSGAIMPKNYLTEEAATP